MFEIKRPPRLVGEKRLASSLHQPSRLAENEVGSDDPSDSGKTDGP